MSAARSKTKCRWLHDWEPWVLLYRSDAKIDAKTVGVIVTQQRVCRRCRFTQVSVDTVFV